MLRYDWPGNVREMRNAVQRLLVLGRLDVESGLPPPQGGEFNGPSGDLDPSEFSYRDAKEVAIKSFEKAYLQKVLEMSESNLSQAARIAGIDRKYLRDLLRRHGLYRSKGGS